MQETEPRINLPDYQSKFERLKKLVESGEVIEGTIGNEVLAVKKSEVLGVETILIGHSLIVSDSGKQVKLSKDYYMTSGGLAKYEEHVTSEFLRSPHTTSYWPSKSRADIRRVMKGDTTMDSWIKEEIEKEEVLIKSAFETLDRFIQVNS